MEIHIYCEGMLTISFTRGGKLGLCLNRILLKDVAYPQKKEKKHGPVAFIFK
jgi:hypothetical protein